MRWPDGNGDVVHVTALNAGAGCGRALLRRTRVANSLRSYFKKIGCKEVKIFKPKQDTRYSKKKVTSHDNNSIKSKPVNSPEKILELSEKFDIIGIDEAQFFDDSIIDVCNKLANAGKRVIVAGLDMDYRGNPFGPMPNLLAIAEYVTKVHAVCTRSGKMASYTHRTVKNEDLVLLGDTRRYEALSRREFIKAKKKKK